MAQADPTFEMFSAQALAQGFTEIVVRTWLPHQILENHTHPFAIKALIQQGDLWLTTVGQTEQHLQAGDVFELAPDIVHSERYGEQGAVFWVARRYDVLK